MTSKNNSQKGFGTVGIILLIVIAVLVVAYFKFAKKTEAPVVTDSSSNKTEEKISNCGLTVNSPLNGASVSFPLTVTATVDNANAETLGCRWTVFEAQAAVIKVMNGSEQIGMGILMADGEWMTTDPVNFTSNVTLSAPAPAGTFLTLVFEEENPSGEGTPDTIAVSVVAQ